MDIVNGLIIFIVGFFLFVIFAVVMMFIAIGAAKLYKSRESLSSIDITDGIDESEIQLIREALLKKSKQDAENAAKAKLSAASEKLAEVARS